MLRNFVLFCKSIVGRVLNKKYLGKNCYVKFEFGINLVKYRGVLMLFAVFDFIRSRIRWLKMF